MCKLHHVAIATENIEKYKELFEKLGMTVERESGEVTRRQLWFYEGIQLKEVNSMEKGNGVDHIALETENVEETVRIALENGCKTDSRADNWFALPNGVLIELMKA